MTQTGYSNAIVNVMLGWLKGLATWVLKLFNLAGSGGNPLRWLSENWLKLLIILLVVGLVMDWLIWMIRWRPYWVWFRKKRIIVNDEKFLAGEEYENFDSEDVDDAFEHDYVVPSTVVKRKVNRQPVPANPGNPQRRKSTAAPRRAEPVRKAAPVRKREQSRDVFSDSLFEVEREHDNYSDFYEDEVFNGSNLPDAPDPERRGRKKRR